MQKMTQEEFNEKYKNDPVFRRTVDKLMAQRSTFKEDETDLDDDSLDQVSGGSNAFKELEGQLWWNPENPN